MLLVPVFMTLPFIRIWLCSDAEFTGIGKQQSST